MSEPKLEPIKKEKLDTFFSDEKEPGKKGKKRIKEKIKKEMKLIYLITQKKKVLI